MRHTLTAIVAAMLLAMTGCGPHRDPRSGHPIVTPGESHSWLGGPGPRGVWAVHHPGESDVVAVIFRDGTRVPTEGLYVSWANEYFPGNGWADLPRLPDDDYPVVLLGRTDPQGRARFVAARRARDGSLVVSDSPPGAP